MNMRIIINWLNHWRTAACSACLFTNPLEVLKTRMQLQGELKARGQHAVYYKNVLHAAYVVVKNDSVLALQKGLVSALWVQMIINGMRLGIFRFASSHGYITDSKGNIVFFKSALVSGLGGVIGQVSASPFFMIKTHLQLQASKEIAVGHQHKHTGTVSALQKIYDKHGFKGLFRGAGGSVPRAFVGSISQLLSFTYSKEWLNTYSYFKTKPILSTFLSSMVGGVAISVMMTPFDLIMTRLYNQAVDAKGKGVLYDNYIDCVRKIFKSEGLAAFYKGVGPMYLRLGPHSALCLTFWDVFTDLYNKYWP